MSANVTVLDTILRDARSRNRRLAISFVDLSKAFDSVSHDTILRAAARVGLPKPLLQYLRSYYTGGTTQVKSLNCRLTNGVRQGDPLSPLLFNAVIDEALHELHESRVGYELNGYLYQALAFADDLILVAETPAGQQQAYDTVAGCLSQGGLRPNPMKCATMTIGKYGKRKAWYCDQKPYLRSGDQLIRAMRVDDAYKYLGIRFMVTGKQQQPNALLTGLLHNLRRAPLKPQQRLHILRAHLLPRLQHQLVLGKVGVAKLHRMDQTLRRNVREMLKLPHDTPSAEIHAAVDDGGLGVMSLQSCVPRLFRERLANLSRCPDPDVQACVNSSTFLNGVGRQLHAVVEALPARTKHEERALCVIDCMLSLMVKASGILAKSPASTVGLTTGPS